MLQRVGIDIVHWGRNAVQAGTGSRLDPQPFVLTAWRRLRLVVHVRFSVWSKDGRAEAAISIDEPEARRLAQFLLEVQHSPLPARLGALIEWLRGSVLRTG